MAGSGPGGGWRGVTIAGHPLAGNPPRARHAVTLLAGRAHQLTEGVRGPARYQRPGPVVCLP